MRVVGDGSGHWGMWSADMGRAASSIVGGEVTGERTAEILLLAATAPAARELVLRAVLNIVKLREVMRPLPQQCGDGLGMIERRRGDVVMRSAVNG